jgi:hypothetical protein
MEEKHEVQIAGVQADIQTLNLLKLTIQHKYLQIFTVLHISTHWS